MDKVIIYLKGERGSTLTFVLIGIAGVLILGASLVSLSTTEDMIAGNDICQLQAHYLAEAGLNTGIAALYQNYLYHQDINGNLTGGTYNVSFELLNNNRRRITSTGTYGNASQTLQAIIGLNEMYQKSLMVADKLTLHDVDIYGQVHVNSDFHVHGNNNILDDPQGLSGGFSWASLTPQFEDAASTLGIVQHNPDGSSFINVYTKTNLTADWVPYQSDLLPLPAVDFEKFAGEATIIYEGTQTFTAAPPADRVLVQGDLTINADNFIYDGIIVVDGQIKVRGPLNNGFDDQVLTLVARNDISVFKIDKTIQVGGRLLIFTNANINISGNLDETFSVRGAMLAEQLDLGSCDVYFDPIVFQDYNQYLPGFGLVVEEWSYPQ